MILWPAADALCAGREVQRKQINSTSLTHLSSLAHHESYWVCLWDGKYLSKVKKISRGSSDFETPRIHQPDTGTWRLSLLLEWDMLCSSDLWGKGFQPSDACTGMKFLNQWLYPWLKCFSLIKNSLFPNEWCCRAGCAHRITFPPALAHWWHCSFIPTSLCNIFLSCRQPSLVGAIRQLPAIIYLCFLKEEGVCSIIC